MKKILIIIISIILFLGIYQICQALILEYPPIRDAYKPGDAPAGQELPELIKYIYLFALGLVGFIALLSMMIAAVLYVTSAGNPSKMGDAKDRIMSAVLGIIILLASVLLLKTISPDLVNIGITMPVIHPAPNGGNGEEFRVACVCRNDDNPSATFFIGCFNVADRQECEDACGPTCNAAPGNHTLQCIENDARCQ